jgi:hypothetical protein
MTGDFTIFWLPIMPFKGDFGVDFLTVLSHSEAIKCVIDKGHP